MDALLVKIFATALTLSQVTTAPDTVKTQFDRSTDQGAVVSLLRAGCVHMRKTFEIEDLNVDDLIATAMEDAEAVAGSMPAFRGINLNDLVVSYRQFCKNETVPNSPVDIAAVIDFYNQAVADLPDAGKLKGFKLPGASAVLDGKGERFAELFEQDQRRVFVPLADIPEHVQRAFIAAEDKRFYEHKGIDERALIRAFIGNLAQSGRPQGGSTITQQVVKNLLVGENVTYERKMREMILTARIERLLSKREILELYLNSTYLGRASSGVEMAARSYFGKPARALTLGEGALLAAMTKGPNYFNPDRHPERAQERLAYVLTRMQEDGAITPDDGKRAQNPTPRLIAYERPRRDVGFHFVDQVTREAKTVAGIDALTGDTYTVRSTVNVQLQRATETALQDGLARYETELGRVQFMGAEANLAEAIRRIEADKTSPKAKPVWEQALDSARPPLYDVHWPVAVIIEKTPVKGGGETIRVGLADGRVMPLSVGRGAAQRMLKLHDVVFVRIIDAKGKNARAELRVRPQVQGAAIVIENKTGRILAMAGGFSYPLSQLNRATQSQRQPGSALKPLTYLAALQKGLQPNTLVRDEAITLPPISGNRAREEDYWTPKNYDGGEGGIITLRRALEHSKNLATVNLLDGAIDTTPALALDRICALAVEAQVYRECVRYYPFVLGAQPVRPIDLAAFYAAIANEGMRLSPYVAGKTGTTDGENDAWFVGFTNDVTVAVWVGYDNADGKRRTLGSGQTGASVAIPIFQPIIQAVWTYHSEKAVLAPPSPEAKRFLVARTVGRGEEEGGGGRGGTVEYFRRDRNGQAQDTQYQLVGREEGYNPVEPRENERNFQPWSILPPQQQQPYGRPQYPAYGRQQTQPQQWGFFGWQQPQQQPQLQPPRSNDPRYRQRQPSYPGYYERW
jgi:penicillin-binding protein 1A